MHLEVEESLGGDNMEACLAKSIRRQFEVKTILRSLFD
jgi:hypothetical protein